MKKHTHLLSLVLLFLFACSEKQKERSLKSTDNLNNYTIKKSDTLVFLSEPGHSMNSNFFSIVDHNLFQQNNLDNSIYSFDINSKIRQFKLSIPEYGPKKIGKIQGFLFNSTDSIYVVAPIQNEIILLDSAMNIHETYPIENDKIKIASFSQMPLLEFDSLFVVSCLPEVDYYNDPRFIIYDKESKKVINNLKISDFIGYKNYNLLFALNSITKLNSNEIAISIGVNETVFIYNLKTLKVTDKINMSSKTFTKTEPIEKNHTVSTKDRLERSYYKTIHKINTDNNTLLLRTTSLSTEAYDPEGNLKSLYDKKQSIIIYDLTNEEKIGEFVLPKNIYDFRTAFTYDNRIYFLLNNPNSENEENLMKFVGYEISEI